MKLALTSRLSVSRAVSRTLPVSLALLLVGAAPGCQRLDDGEEGGSGNDGSMSAGNDDETGGGTLLTGVDGSGPIDETDDEPSVEDECDPVEQTGCGPGEKCTTVITGAGIGYSCVTDAAPLQPGEGCEVSLSDGVDGCPAGFVCLGEEDGTCRAHCGTQNDCEAATCLEDPFDAVPHCADDCTPFEPTCDGALLCRRRGERFACLDAQSGDIGGAGADCQVENDAGCAAGLACIPGALVPGCNTTNCCAPFCDLDAATDSCEAPSTCSPALDSAAPGFENIGACFVPA